MAGFDTLRKIINSALNQAAEETGMLLGKTLSVEEADQLQSNRMSYFTDLDDALFLVGVESTEEYPGHFHMVFSLRDALTMSGILLGIPPARIAEKCRLMIMGPEDIDAFSEIANQFIGSFNAVFKPRLPNKVRLKQLPPTRYIPGMDEMTDDSPLPEAEYLLFQASFDMQDDEKHRIDLLIPLELAELFDPQQQEPVVEEGLETAGVQESGDDSFRPLVSDDILTGDGIGAVHAAGDSDAATVLILDNDATIRRQATDLLAGPGFNPVAVPCDSNIEDLVALGDIRLVILGLENANERELALCKTLQRMSRSAPPIIVCANQWTRTAVLQAVQYGAKDIIVKPYNQAELMAKVGKFLQAA